jgi:hypothetical protein
VLDTIVKESSKAEQRVKARQLKNTLQSFEFIFKLFFMRNILGITNDLSQALQRKDQDIVNAMTFVKVSKARLQNMREDGKSKIAMIIFNTLYYKILICYHLFIVWELTI